MDLRELLTTVRESAALDPERLLDFIYEKTTGKSSIYRGILRVGENIAVKQLGAKVIDNGKGDHMELLNGNSSVYDDLTGYTSHDITNDRGIVVELGNNYIINHLRILLWDRDDRSFSYYVEVSVNQIDWERVVDYSDRFCRSWQRLYFPSRAVRHIKLVGTMNTKNAMFQAVSLEAFNIRDLPSTVNGFISPTWNVATVVEGARVIKGIGGSGGDPNLILSGDVGKYAEYTGFTFHEFLEGECIIVQLSQPFNIDAMRLLLWDLHEGRAYSFYIETSTNQKDWQMAVDKRNEQVKSWQQFSFESRLVVFIRIVGTYNSEPDNRSIHVVYFEARCGQFINKT